MVAVTEFQQKWGDGGWGEGSDFGQWGRVGLGMGGGGRDT